MRPVQATEICTRANFLERTSRHCGIRCATREAKDCSSRSNKCTPWLRIPVNDVLPAKTSCNLPITITTLIRQIWLYRFMCAFITVVSSAHNFIKRFFHTIAEIHFLFCMIKPSSCWLQSSSNRPIAFH